MQITSYPYCNTTTDLQRAFKDIERFAGVDTLDGFTLTSGQSNTYEQLNTGFYGVIYQSGAELTVQTSIANAESNAGSFYYDSTNDILYVHSTNNADPDTHTITGAVDDWSDLKATMRNDAMEIVESMLDVKFPRPLPFSSESANSEKYDVDIRKSTALIACSEIIRYRDPDNPLADKLENRVWDAENESGILWEHSTGTRAFSFEATKDEYLGNMKNITLDSASTGRIYISGNPSKSLRYKYRLKCSTAGVVETAVFTLSIDGGLTYSGSYNTYANYTHITDGFYVRFEGTFVLNDEWELWAATTKSKTNSRLGSIDLIPV